MGILNKAAFVEAAKPKVEKVEIGEDSFVLVSEISQTKYELITEDPKNKTEEKDENDKLKQNWYKTMTALIIASVVDENGTCMFTEEDEELVSGFSREMRNKITDACLKANGFAAEEKKPSEAIKDASYTGELQSPSDTDTPTN